ncbi:MAG: lipopolysaccharide heptosyltransferase I [Pseudomonadales bacterium]|nr:lipopolysaccharide heptosyltransferase I [Pseudomonadales bacterium]
MSRKSVLLIKTSSLGDVVHALPAVNDAIDNGMSVDWVVEESFADIARQHPGVGKVIPVAWRRWRKNLFAHREEVKAFVALLRESHYDQVIDSQGLIKSALFAACARGPKAGFSHTSAREPWSAFFYSDRCRIKKGGHAIDRQRQLLSAVLGYDVLPSWRSGIERAPATGNQVFLLHGTTWATKHWPEAMWIDLVQRFVQEGMQPIVTWGDESEKIRAELLVEAGATMIDRRPLDELIEILAASVLVVTVDSGLGHLAAALGVPTTGLYGATSGDLTGCRGKQAKIIQGDTMCSPCVRKKCTQYVGPDLVWQHATVYPPCFASITPERVFVSSRGQLQR